jgi:hypothetical protein
MTTPAHVRFPDGIGRADTRSPNFDRPAATRAGVCCNRLVGRPSWFGVMLRAIFVGLVLVSAGCGGEGDPDDGSAHEPGLETGPCLSGQQCAAGLVCASELCVDLGGSEDGGDAGPTSSPSDGPGGTSGSADMEGGNTPADAGMDGADADADAGGDAGDDAGGDAADDAADDGGAGAWCPVPPAALSCTTTCDLFQFECYECPNEPGDLCTYYDYQYDACLSGCEYVKSTPGDFTYEVFACRQFAGNDCSDADVDCLLEIDCSGV